MQILITGASGFIGSQLALYAQQQGYKVVATGMTRTSAEALRIRELKSHGIHVNEGDLHDEPAIAELLAGCEAVIHLAAAQHEAGVPESYFFEVNVEATRRLLKASIAARVKRFVYGSTIGVYGDANGGSSISETTVLNPQNAYARSKVVAEALVRDFGAQLPSVIVRISETYGPGDFRLLKLFKSICRGVFIKVGSGKNKRQPIHVRDLARGLLLSTQHPDAAGETFVFAGPQVLTTHEAASTIASALKIRPQHVRVPLIPLMIASRFIAGVCEKLGVQPPLHPRRLDFFVKSFWFDTSKAQQRLGFEPTIAFSEGVQDTISWYDHHGLLRGPSRSTDLRNPQLADVPLALSAQKVWQHSEILEFTHDAIIIWEMDGRGILHWSRAAEQLYAYPRGEALGKVTHALLRTELQGGIAQLEGQLSRLGVWSGHLHHTAKDGNEIVVQARLELMGQQDGRWLVLEVNRDLSIAPPIPT